MIAALKKLVTRCINLLGYDIHRIPGRSLYPSSRLKTINESELKYRKIHYGCGLTFMKGWINVDRLSRPATELSYFKVDLVEYHPFPDNIFDFGYAEDFLEHLSQADSLIFLCEAYRTLRPGGVLRLSFPGFEQVLKSHYSDKGYHAAVKGKVDAYETWNHLHFYSREELALVGSHIGFRKMVFTEHGKSEHDELRDIDIREKQINLNTYVEMIK
jgi:predicted SAM-dependent methyltransferase